MASHTNYIQWLVSYSGLLGPVAGIMIADYFLVRGTRLDTESLYRREGPYEYRKGFNPRALVALAAGVFAALVGLVISDLRFLYDYAWFVGFAVAALVYIVLIGNAPSSGRSDPAGPAHQGGRAGQGARSALGNSAGAKARTTTARVPWLWLPVVS